MDGLSTDFYNLSAALDDYHFLLNANCNFSDSDAECSFNDAGINGDQLINQIMAEHLYRYRRPLTALLIGLYCVSFLVGLIGNFTVICVFAANRHMKTITNSFLVNLAACDLMVVLMCMPFSVAQEAYANWVYGDAMCKLVNFCQGLAVISSILTLAVISAERFYAIHNPLKARAFLSKCRMKRLIVFVWLLAGLAASPCLLVRKEREINNMLFHIKICEEQWAKVYLKHVYNFALLGILYVGPLIFIVLGYLHIAVRLWTRNGDLHATARITDAKCVRANIKGRRKVAKMLFVMAVLFAISWLPFNVISIILDYMAHETQLKHGADLHILHTYSLWLAHCNSSINPICYCIMSQTFKKTLQANLGQCFSVKVRNKPFSSFSQTLTFSTPINGLSKTSHSARSHSRVYLGHTYYKSNNPGDSCIEVA